MSAQTSSSPSESAVRLATAEAIARELNIDPHQPGTARLALALAEAIEHDARLKMLLQTLVPGAGTRRNDRMQPPEGWGHSNSS